VETYQCCVLVWLIAINMLFFRFFRVEIFFFLIKLFLLR